MCLNNRQQDSTRWQPANLPNLCTKKDKLVHKNALICITDAMEDLQPFIENINRKIRLSPDSMERLTAAFQLIKVKKKQLLIQPGFVAKYRIYVLQGAFHSYVIDDKGNEHTIQFAVDEWWLSDYNS